jgi:hypothetical protein
MAKLRKNERNAKEKLVFLLHFRVHSNFGEARVTKKACKKKAVFGRLTQFGLK